MTATVPTSITALPRGYAFPPATFTPAADDVSAYLAATGDATAYGDCLPPLAVAALGLSALQSVISLPEGSLHTGQEVEQLALARAGEPMTLTGRIAQRSERQGYVISVIEFEVRSPAGAAGGPTTAVVIRARTTIMAPAEGIT